MTESDVVDIDVNEFPFGDEDSADQPAKEVHQEERKEKSKDRESFVAEAEQESV